MCMTNVLLEPSTYFEVTSLNKIPKGQNADDKSSQEIFDSSYMNPMDTRQYLYKLIPKPEHRRELTGKVTFICT